MLTSGSRHLFSARKFLKVIAGVAALLLLTMSGLLGIPHVMGFSNGQNASLVIGQSNFTSNSSGTTQSSLFQPGGMSVDSSGNIWVADIQNNRILEFKSPFSAGESASLVLGESNFTTSVNPCYATTLVNPSCLSIPESLTFDPSGNLWVADSGNGRILEFVAPFVNYENASVVIGQPNFSSSSGPSPQTTQATLNLPSGIAFDSSSNLWVADSGNSRVL